MQSRLATKASALALLLPALATAPAMGFDGLVVFGDSLSDVGNVQMATSALSPLVPTTPGPFYFDGRFSNGPNYVDVLSAGLGFGEPQHSLIGGGVYAYGGARTSGTPFPTNLVVQDIDDQVTQFLGTNPVADPDDLFVVFAGGNDFGAGQTDVSVPVNNLAADIERLYDAGARQVLAPNLPLLGLVPRNNGDPAQAAAANALSMQFNVALEMALGALEADNPGLTIFRLDAAGLFSAAVANPSAFGLVNVVDPAAPGLEPGDQTYDTSLIAPNANQYLFWDELHPTTAGHALLGQAALAAVPEPASLGTIALGGFLLMRRPSR